MDPEQESRDLNCLAFPEQTEQIRLTKWYNESIRWAAGRSHLTF
jgi:hypothetical protein